MPIQKEKVQEGTKINKIIAVMSGKGGVGKSSVTSLLAVALRNKGYKVGIMDADITGPSIPKIFGINKKRAVVKENIINPVETTTGIKVISLNLLLNNEEEPVIWRGPIVAGTVKQFYTDVNWLELDYLLIDLPPGTSDVPLTIMQSLPIDGIITVTSPQDVVNLIVQKSVIMAKKMGVPVYGIVENMSYYECPNCNEKHYIFGKNRTEDAAKALGLPIIAKLPIDSEFVDMCDAGKIEVYSKINFGISEDLANTLIDITKEA